MINTDHFKVKIKLKKGYIVKIWRKSKKTFTTIKNSFSYHRINIKCNHNWYGKKHAGFYVCDDILNKDSIIYSFGVGEDITFDVALIAKFSCHVYAFDPTPKSIEWVHKQRLPPNFYFFEYGIGKESGLVDFYLPKNVDHVSGSLLIQDNVSLEEKVEVSVKSFNDIIRDLNPEKIDILKIDIEGTEYNIIDDILKANIPVTQIFIEFHERFIPDGKRKTRNAISKMKKHGYKIFAISDSKEEISFIRKT